MLCFAAPTFAAGKPIKNKTKHVELANLNVRHGFACNFPAPYNGEQCTTGRVDSDASSLESPELVQVERIDFIFVVPATPGARCAGVIQRFAPHPRRPAATTGLFAATPRLPCGEAPLPTCFVSDHSGNQLKLGCQP